MDDKVIQWHNATNHFKGDHEKCLHPKDAGCYLWKDGEIGNNSLFLDLFLNSSSKLFYHADTSISTQMCESLHAIKTHFVNKLINWGSSWKYRMAAAILEANEEVEIRTLPGPQFTSIG